MKFWEVYKEKVLGTIKGLDRIRFRGTLRWLSSERGMNTFMSNTGMLLKDFGKWAGEKTERLRSFCEQQANSLSIPIIYLNSSSVDKEKLAKKIAMACGSAFATPYVASAPPSESQNAIAHGFVSEMNIPLANALRRSKPDRS